jgi:hypothetical protein
MLLMPSVEDRAWRAGTARFSTVRTDNTLKVRFWATLGHKEPEIELALV